MLAPAHRPERVLAVVAHPDDAELLPFGRCGGGVRGDGSQPAPSRDRPRPGRAWRLSALPMTVRRPRTGGEAARVAPAGAAFRGVPRLLTSRVRRPQPASVTRKRRRGRKRTDAERTEVAGGPDRARLHRDRA